MTNQPNRIIIADRNIAHDALPADADAHALMLDIIDSATLDIQHSMRYARDRFDIISDYDDYIPATSRILTATIDRFLAHIDQTPRDALLALIADPDFLDDLMTCDCTFDLHRILNLDYLD